MWLLREAHEVAGAFEAEHESIVRDQWMPLVAQVADARLLYYLKHAHGTGPSYRVITFTALADAAAYGALCEDVRAGALRSIAEKLDAVRHDVRGRLYEPLPWSALREVDLATVPTAPTEHAPSVFMEDTVWPYEGRLEAYVESAGTHYATEMAAHESARQAILHLLGGFRTVYGSGPRREILLWQRVVEPRALLPLVTREVPPEYRKPGTWMHDALAVRDQWESRLLRTVPWSPLS
jgi:hypothetical protein